MTDLGVASDASREWPTRRFSIVAAVAALGLVGGLGGWAAFAGLAGAVIAPGEVRVASNRQVVQHRFGGTVAAILARDGDAVQTGEVLLRLNDTQLKAERAILQRRLDKGRTLHARLVAERDGAEAISFGAALLARAERDTDLAELMAGETRLFKARASTYLQAAMVRFPAFNARTTPELAGVVERVSPDRMVDEVAGQHYYAVEIAVSPGELERLDGRSLIPGMPAEVFVRTAERTPLSYLVKPLSDHLQRALREE